MGLDRESPTRRSICSREEMPANEEEEEEPVWPAVWRDDHTCLLPTYRRIHGRLLLVLLLLRLLPR